MIRSIAAITLLVREYDEAIAFFGDALRFTLTEDKPPGDNAHWVAMAPQASGGTSLLLARAATPE